MKICLVYPPSFKEKPGFLDILFKELVGRQVPNLTYPYLASYLLENSSHEVSIVDAKTLELNPKQTIKRIKKERPDIVGLTGFTLNIKDAFSLAKLVKEELNLPTIVGGPHVTFTDEISFKECPYIDIIARGEAEQTLVNILDSLEKNKNLKNVSGISFKNNGHLKRTEDAKFIQNIDSVPFPAWELTPIKKSSFKSGYGMILSSRGCPYKCIFCSSSLMCGKFWRAHSAKRVFDEIKYQVDEFKVKTIEIVDDNFILNKKRALEIAKMIINEKLDVKFHFDGRVDNVDRELLSTLRKAGFKLIYYGIESADQNILNYYQKGINVSQIVNAIKLAKECDMIVTAGIVFCHKDTRRSILKTLSLCLNLGVDFVSFALMIPLPGTPVYYMEKKKIFSYDWYKYDGTNVLMKPENMSEVEMQFWQVFCSIALHLGPQAILKDPGMFKKLLKFSGKLIFDTVKEKINL